MAPRKNREVVKSRAQTSSRTKPIAVGILQACDLVGLRRSSLYQEIGAGRIRAIKSGRRTLVPIASLEHWIATRPEFRQAGQR
ncbi:MAG: helix-turn-helix domain-containing protein [Alphaproteobacteria bacterium]|nr:helix-turn-helix domain-containing protein [Alphaproteobacteria bacterium]